MKKYVVGNRYVGTVSMVDLNGVFVSLDGASTAYVLSKRAAATGRQGDCAHPRYQPREQPDLGCDHTYVYNSIMLLM